jgi:hypothetical protein
VFNSPCTNGFGMTGILSSRFVLLPPEIETIGVLENRQTSDRILMHLNVEIVRAESFNHRRKCSGARDAPVSST